MKLFLECATLNSSQCVYAATASSSQRLWQWCGSTGTEEPWKDGLPSDGAGFGEIDRGEPGVACVPQIRRRAFSLSPIALFSHWQRFIYVLEG
jgi:hypothetical protein